MTQKRINLCFDIDDAKQKEVYEYLTRSGRRKTAVVMAALTQTVMKDAYWRNMQMDRDAQLCERFASIVRENNSSGDLDDIKAAINTIMEKLDNVAVVQATGENPGNAQAISTANAPAKPIANEPEMSDAAFEAMMAFI